MSIGEYIERIRADIKSNPIQESDVEAYESRETRFNQTMGNINTELMLRERHIKGLQQQSDLTVTQLDASGLYEVIVNNTDYIEKDIRYVDTGKVLKGMNRGLKVLIISLDKNILFSNILFP